MALPLRTFRRHLLITACVIGGVGPLLAEDKQITILKTKPGAPEGFEAFNEPNDTTVDLFYGGLKIGLFRAVYTPDHIVFAASADIVHNIPALKPDAVPLVEKALTGELPTQAGLICGRVPKEGCGKLHPEVAGVIFNEDKFHAELFINPAMLADQDTHTDKILPPAPEIFSGVHAMNVAAVGTVGNQPQYSLADNSVLAYGAGRINWSGIASNEQKQIRAFSASLDKWGLDNRVGFFDSRPMQLLSQVPMSGVSVGTSLNTNLALRDASGTRLSIFLPQRSWVSLIYNNTIYSTDFYEAGNQILNTSALPEGAYELTLRIRDMNGVQTEERRFFAKNFAIPPIDQPVYYGQLGSVRTNDTQTSSLPKVGTGLIAGGGMIRRFNDATGINSDFLIIKNQLLAETGAFLLLPPDHQFRATMLVGSQSDVGFGASYLGYAMDKKLALTADGRIIFAGKRDPIADINDPITGDTRQLTASMVYQLTNLASISLEANYASTEGGQRQYAYGPEARYDFWREGPSNLSLMVSSSKTQDGMADTIFLRYSKQIDSWNFSGEGGSQRTPGPAGSTNVNSGNARVTWNDDKNPGKLTVIGAEAHRDNNANNYTADLDHRGTFGNLKLIASHTDSTASNTFYSGNLGFSVAHTSEDVAWGGNQQQESGILIKNSGNAVDAPMSVMVDRSERTTFKTGQCEPLFLAPYQTYNITLKPQDGLPLDVDGSVKTVTLYPGNIIPLVWDVNRIYVVLGHVTLPDGTPLVNARLEEGRNITVTDEEGLFQGEVLALKKITFKRNAEQPPASDEDLFSFVPPPRPQQSRPSSMSREDQNRALAELFGEEETPPPAENSSVMPAPPPVAPPPPVQMAEAKPARTLLPAVRCEVELPEMPEVNGVVMYASNLICKPIPFADEIGPPMPGQQNAPPPDDKGKEKEAGDFHVAAGLSKDEVAELLVKARKETPGAAPSAREVPAMLAELLPFTPMPPQLPALKTEMQSAAFSGMSAEPEVASVLGGAIEVQMGAFRTRGKALEVRDMLVRMYRELEDRQPYIVKVNLGKKGIYYRLRVSDFADTGDAAAFCHAASARGQECFIVTQEARRETTPEVIPAAVGPEESTPLSVPPHYIMQPIRISSGQRLK